MAGYDQANRILAINTKLGTDKAVLTEVEGEDAISKPFLFRIRFSTEEPAEKVQKLLGTEVTLWFGRPGESDLGITGVERRPLHGHFSRLTRGFAQRGDATEWRAEVVPALWFLSRTSDCRIFQEKSVPDIVKAVLDLHGVKNVQMKLTGSYDPLDYCVQYRETALDFISRLMEQNGIFFWHEHEMNRHTLVIADDNGSTFAAPFSNDLPITGREDSDAIRRLDEDFAVRSGKWSLRDFNFETPSVDLEVNEPTQIDVEQMKSRERYDYPGLYPDKGLGKQAARLQIEREEAFHQQRRGESGVAGFNAGMRVKIEGIEDSEVLITEVRHRAEDYSHWTTQAWGRRQPTEPHYDNEFVCIPKSVKFRPERVTPKPSVHGPQTAIVTGPSGEEIHTDKYGRVKVQFHWDRLGKKDDKSSCWIRVSQGWAGQNWGQIHIPRIGHEVIVDFLEGDPDRPIITGRVYNAESQVPYGLPANKTQSGIKTNSTKGGGGSNEYRFEDKKGSEQIYIHAEKDYDTEVENNETRKVGLKGTGDRTTTIKNNETLTVGNDKNTTVNGHFTELIQKTEFRAVTGDVTETFMANETRTIASSMTETIGASVTQTIGASFTQTVGAAVTQTVGTSIAQTAGVSIAITAGASITLTAPSIKQIGPSWFKTGLASGDAYVFKTSNSAVKTDVSGVSIGIVAGLKFDVAGIKMDNFGLSIKTGGIEIKNKALAVRSKAFETKRGLKLYSA
ncbi:type VI secretion system Vgr family protein [Neoroseomonas soli]|uniref:Type VI secretion system tip protein VgrG n=1 Tax=Neoroseomonas soli TaxID=1081025 RepID=A0A9X9X1J3_9PROT|nr:type VI secretion system tip protein TssI/VgrG [Neoroseomonas soli]MBR0673272.1 type VI secretion system tip protein VgrG [Neoroseomonas soli]